SSARRNDTIVFSGHSYDAPRCAYRTGISVDGTTTCRLARVERGPFRLAVPVRPSIAYGAPYEATQGTAIGGTTAPHARAQPPHPARRPRDRRGRHPRARARGAPARAAERRGDAARDRVPAGVARAGAAAPGRG